MWFQLVPVDGLSLVEVLLFKTRCARINIKDYTLIF